MKQFLSLIMSLIISGLCFGSELPPWMKLSYGSYSNLRDPTFVKAYNVESVTNYWDAQRSSLVYAGICRSEVSNAGGTLITYRKWVEQDRKIVDFENINIFKNAYTMDTKAAESVVNELLTGVDTIIQAMDGYPVIDSTRNIQYRGDSAKRCKAIYEQWAKNFIEKKPDDMPLFGLEWRKGNEYMAVTVAVAKSANIAITAQKLRCSDRRIDEEVFKETTTYSDYKNKKANCF